MLRLRMLCVLCLIPAEEPTDIPPDARMRRLAVGSSPGTTVTTAAGWTPT